MKNIIISNHRSGSTYLVNTLGQICRTIDDKHVPLGEVAHPGRQWGWLNMDPKTKALIKDHTYKTGDNVKRHRGLEYSKKLDHHLTCLNETSSDYTCKVFIENYIVMNHLDFWRLFDNNDDAKLVVLYRRDLEDLCMSRLFMDLYKITNSQNIQSKQIEDPTWTYDPQIHYSGSTHFGILEHALMTNNWLRGFRHNYKDKIHELRTYEGLDGTDYKKDFQRYFDDPIDEVIPKIKTIRKLLNKDEKIDRISNYEDFKKDFDSLLDKFDLPAMLD